MRLIRCLGTAAVLAIAGSLSSLGNAAAAQVKIDFESGAVVNQPVTNQYGTPGTPAGPFFKKGTDAGFYAGSNPGSSGLSCGPPVLTNSYPAHSGSNSLLLNGCLGGEFTGTAAFFALGYTTNYVEFQVGLAGGTPSWCPNFICAEIWTTAFDKNRNVIAQQQTLLGPNTLFKGVPLISSGQDIAFVAIERGSRTPFSNDSATGVYLASGTPLIVDDLIYEPPSSPPESSFVLGAKPNWTRTSPGGTVGIDIPVTWVNNPNPSAASVALELSAPSGVDGTFSPNPTATGTSRLTITVDKSTPAGSHTLRVDGYVDKGLPSQKHAVTTIALEVEEPIVVQPPGTVEVAPCTPLQIPIQVATGSAVTDPLTLEAEIYGSIGVSITSISGGGTVTPHFASTTVSPSSGLATATITLSVAAGTAPAGPNLLVFRAGGSGYPKRSRSGLIAIEAGHVDKALEADTNLAPFYVLAPQLGKPGTKVKLKGAGFCPGTKVAIGAANDAIGPESISDDGRSLDFRVTRGATTGAVHVLPATGTPFDGPNLAVMTFRDAWGFKTANEDWGVPLDGTMVDEIFGVGETNINLLGWLIRKPEAMLFEGTVNKHVPGGLCFGMAYLSALMHNTQSLPSAYPSTPQFPWSITGAKPWDLNGDIDPTTKLPKPSPSLLRSTLEFFSLQFSDELIPVVLDQAIGGGQGLAGVKAELAQGHPALIGLVKWNGLKPQAHTVLAYDVVDRGDGSSVIFTYNPNVPYSRAEEANAVAHDNAEFTQSQIIIDQANNWSFPHFGWTGGNKNLIIFPYHKLPFINGKSPHMPNVFVAAILWVFGSGGDQVTQVTDSGGGALAEQGQVAPAQRWPSGMAPLPDFGGTNELLQMMTVDDRAARSGPTRAHVRRGAGGGSMHFGLHGSQIAIDAAVSEGQEDDLTIDRRKATVTYAPGAARTKIRADLTRTASSRGKNGSGARTTRAGSGAGRAARVRTIVGRGGVTLRFAGGSTVEVRNHGSATTVTTSLTALDRGRRPVAVKPPTTRLPADATLRIAPLDWRKLDSGFVRMTVTSKRGSDTRIVRGHLIGRSFATARNASARSGDGAISLSLRLHRMPSGASVSPAVQVLRGRKVIARSRPSRFDGQALHAPLTIPLDRELPAGRYRLRMRLLETVADGPIQGSRVHRELIPLLVRP